MPLPSKQLQQLQQQQTIRRWRNYQRRILFRLAVLIAVVAFVSLQISVHHVNVNINESSNKNHRHRNDVDTNGRPMMLLSRADFQQSHGSRNKHDMRQSSNSIEPKRKEHEIIYPQHQRLEKDESTHESSLGYPLVVSATVATTTPTKTQGNTNNKRHSYKKTETDVLCPSCRYTYMGRRPNQQDVTCLTRILRKQEQLNLTLTRAAINVAQAETPPDVDCRRCNPEHCSAADKRYWRLDDAAPRVHAAVTHHLQSVAPRSRLNAKALQNLTQHFSKKRNVYPARDYLFEFNPSLVQLPVNQVEPTNRQCNGAPVVYLASFRVSNMHNCITDHDSLLRAVGGNWPRRPGQVKDYVGLALLRADLSICAETVIDAKAVTHKLQDVRLYVLQNQIYLGSYHRMTPLWVVPPVHLPPNETMTVPGLWESSLAVTMRTFGSCSKDREVQRKGKNLNYFVDADNRTMMEVSPKGPKEEIDLHSRCTRAEPEAPPGHFVVSNQTVPLPSFRTIDELHFARNGFVEPPITDDRGSACCVPIVVNGRRLLLGIAHSKIKYNHKAGTDAWRGKQLLKANHFFSSFYAMQNQAPYQVVAQSGKFCFGFGTDRDSTDNPYTEMNLEILQVMGETYECPRIHFVSGMVEKADDASKLIIAYGVNDCVPRMVVVGKAEIIQMLFSPQERLPIDTS